MGVPAFFKWLTLRYPNIVIDVNEEISEGIDINTIIKNNFNRDLEIPSIDNLYFDMNGIIHPCAHPQDRDSPESIAEMFNGIFDYVDKIIKIIKPKKLIYLAIDGVAPRAKMNQQRSRRFRAALESKERKTEFEILKNDWNNKGLYNDFNNNKKVKFEFDSNVITPGTKFLYDCSLALKSYIKSRLNNDPLWKDLTVIFSDSSVPGEGEHKILDFIRNQRTFENYNPNTTHCIYGADADLIMLSLIIHEPHFYIIRESLNEKFYIICQHCGKHGHSADTCEKITGSFNRDTASKKEIYFNNKEKINEIEFSLIKIPVVREYLEIEFKILEKKIKFKYDLERIIDDFVFLCFLVGNDFLPHLPSLKIREGAIDALIYLYKKILPTMDSYITNGKGQINLDKAEILFENLGKIEGEFFKIEVMNKINDENFKKSLMNNPQRKKKKNILEIFNSLGSLQENKNENKDNNEIENNNSNDDKKKDNPEEIDLVESTKLMLEREEDNEKKDFSLEELKKYGKQKFKMLLDERIKQKSNQKASEYKDKIKYNEEGFKDRYYTEKFKINPNSKKELSSLKQKIKKYYIEGICWVFEYYYNGVPSWSWFYPFHYAPFASDLINISKTNIKFSIGKPFNSFEQLLSVLPPYSSKALPLCLQKLMNDPFSPISDFYPDNIKLDINGMPYAWMGVNLIPFVDEKIIKKIVKEKMDNKEFNHEELILNKTGKNILISKSRKPIKYVNGIFEVNEKINTFNKKLKGNEFNSDLFIDDVEMDKCICFDFEKKENGIRHKSKILKGVIKDKKCVLLDNLDFYKNAKFKGKQAIDIVKRILGYIDDEEIESNFRDDYFDDRTDIGYNNNRGREYNPEEMQFLKKKRHQESIKDMENAKEKKLNNQNININQNLNINQNINLNPNNITFNPNINMNPHLFIQQLNNFVFPLPDLKINNVVYKQQIPCDNMKLNNLQLQYLGLIPAMNPMINNNFNYQNFNPNGFFPENNNNFNNDNK